MKKFAVIGLGHFGFAVAKTIFEEGHEVIAIDLDRQRIQEIEPFCTEGIVMDATDKEKLKSLGLEEFDSVVVSAGGDKISISILICLHLQEIGVKHILVKARDEDHEKILKKVGASEAILPEMAMGIRIAKGLSKPNIMDFIPLVDEYNIFQIDPPRAFIGKSLIELNLRAKYNVHVIAIRELVPENFLLVPPADFVIKDSDILIMIGRPEDVDHIKALK